MAKNPVDEKDEVKKPDDGSSEPEKPLFKLSEETLRSELESAHTYYLDAIKMVAKVPAAASAVFFGLMAGYGLLMRALASVTAPGNTATQALIDVITTLLWVIPAVGVFASVAFLIAQFVSIFAMDFSSEVYLKPNRERLSLPSQKHPRQERFKGGMRMVMLALFVSGHMVTLLAWGFILFAVLSNV